jgi:undecaprenyl-diphosphatase
MPAVVLSSSYQAVNRGNGHAPGAGLTGLAVVCAFVVGLVSIHWLMRWLVHHSTLIFVYYRLALGALILALLSTGVVHASS